MGPRHHTLRHLAATAVLSTVWLTAGCTWDPWIPGEGKLKPMPTLDPALRSQALPLDSAWVDELNCFARRCEKRFRLIVDRPGQLTVGATLDLASEDEQARLVLESIQGVLGQDGTGRGTRTDAVSLGVRHRVEPGVYFVLLQGIGGAVPYELTATLTPEAAPEPIVVAAVEPPGPQEALPPLTKLKFGPGAGAAYDPGVLYSHHETFSFPRKARGEDAPQAGTPVEAPEDRRIRRYVAEALELKGFRQALGNEEPDLMVGFSTSHRSTVWYASYYPTLYDGYLYGAMGLDPLVYERGVLVIDVIDARTERLAWHAWTTKGLGPGIVQGEPVAALTREAVGDVLAKFPPH